jgi:hypothetical protein
MTFVKWWLSEFIIPSVCVMLSVWFIAMLLKVLNYLYQLI